MKTIISFELKKIFGNRKSIVCIILLLLSSIGFFALDCYDHQTLSRLEYIKETTTYYTGQIEPERIAPIVQARSEIVDNPANWQISGDSKILNPELRQELDLLEYTLSMNQLNDYRHEYIRQLQAELSSTTSNDERLLLEKEIALFQENPDLSVGYNLFFDYYVRFLNNFAIIILGFLIILLLTPLFNMEYSTHMDGLILSSKKGKRALIYGKLCTALITITIVHVLVIGLYSLLCGAFWGFDGGGTSLSAMFYDPFQYILSPYGLTMGQFYLISVAISFCACIGIGAFTILLSSKIRNPVLCMSIVLTAFFVPVLIYALSGTNEIQNIINYSYGRIMQVAPLFCRYRGMVVFGKAVSEKDLALVLLGVTTAIFTWLSFRTFKKHEVEN